MMKEKTFDVLSFIHRMKCSKIRCCVWGGGKKDG